VFIRFSLIIVLFSCSLLQADSGPVPFPPRYTIKPEGLEPWALQPGDFNSDGARDLAVLHSSGVSLLFNRGDGTFEARDISGDRVVRCWPYRNQLFAAGDWNGDGALDLALLPDCNHLRIFSGKGDGTFPGVKEFDFDWIGCIASEDLDGDGLDDLALSIRTVEPAWGGLRILFSTGDGGFSPVDLDVPGGSPGGVAILKAGTERTLAVVSEVGSKISVHLAKSRGDRTFEPWTPLEIFDVNGEDIRSGDLNGDGREELILIGDGGGGFRVVNLEPEPVVIFTYQDGVRDVHLSPGKVYVLDSSLIYLSLDAQLEVVESTRFSTGGIPQCLAIADFNGDGLPDGAVGNYGALWHDEPVRGSVTVALREGGRFRFPLEFSPTGGNLRQVKLVDLDFDGDLDALAALSTSEPSGDVAMLAVLERVGGAWMERNRIHCQHKLAGLEVADLNGDGHLDIIGCDSWIDYPPTDSLSVFIGKDPFVFSNPVRIPVGESPVAARVADVNQDSFPDIVTVLHGCQCWPGNESFLAVLPGKGDGTFGEPLSVPAGGFARDLALFDFDGDGSLDALVAGQDLSTQRGPLLFRGSPGGSFTRVGLLEETGVWDIEVGDADSDGEDEVVLAGNRIAYCEITAQGLGPPRLLPEENLNLQALAIADADGDGINDVLAAENIYNPVDRLLYFRGLGQGEFARVRHIASGLAATDVSVVSVDPGEDPVVVVSGCPFEHANNFFVTLPRAAFQSWVLFVRGDANGDRCVDLADVLTLIRYLFEDSTLSCRDAADANDGGDIGLGDAIYLLEYLFLSGPLPAVPFPEGGEDPTPDGLGCASYPVIP